jgi:hypothetical protein
MSTTLTREVRKEAMRIAGREMAAVYGKPVPFIGLMILGNAQWRRTFCLWCVAIVLHPDPSTYSKN